MLQPFTNFHVLRKLDKQKWDEQSPIVDVIAGVGNIAKTIAMCKLLQASIVAKL